MWYCSDEAVDLEDWKRARLENSGKDPSEYGVVLEPNQYQKVSTSILMHDGVLIYINIELLIYLAIYYLLSQRVFSSLYWLECSKRI